MLLSAALFFALIGAAAAKGETLQQRLRQHLLSTYDAGSLPPNDVTNVTMKFTLRNYRVKEREPSAELNVWITMTWFDPRLTWSALSAAHVPRLTFSPGLVWEPDVALTNSEDASDGVRLPSTRLVVHPNGEVRQLCPASLSVACTPDVRNWPHDLRTCAATFGSWVHDSDALDLIVAEEPVTMDMIQSQAGGDERNSHLAWAAIGSEVRRSTQEGSNSSVLYPYVTLTLQLQRRPSWDVDTVRVVFVAISLVTSVVFLLPPWALEKALLGMLFLLLQLLVLGYTILCIPKSFSDPPILVDVMCGQIILTVIVVIAGALGARLARCSDARVVPAFVRSAARPIGTCCRSTSQGGQQADELHGLQESERMEALRLGRPDSATAAQAGRRDVFCTSNEMVAAAADRCCLVIYLAVVLIILLVNVDVIFL